MIQKKKVSKVTVLLGALGIAMSVFFCPVAAIPAQAALPGGESVAEPQRDIVEYRYFIFDGNKVYKRLYNYSTGNWVGEWIFVRELPEQP